MTLFHGEFRRGLRPLIAATVGAGCGLTSIPFYTHGVFVVPVAGSMGWGRGETQFAFAFLMMSAIVTAPAVGVLIDRFGARRIALVSIPLLGATFGGLSLSGSGIWSYYLLWICMAVLASGTLPVTWTRVVNTWFDKRRGLALGLTMSGTGIAAALSPVLAASLIETYGWEVAYRILGIVIVVIALPIAALWLREAPRTSQDMLKGSAGAGVRLSDALRTLRFWILGLAFLCVSVGIGGLITNLVPMLLDRGLDPGSAAEYAGFVGVSVIAGRLVTGFLIDKLWAPGIAFAFLSAPAVSCLLLSVGLQSDVWLAIAALIVGLAAGAELDLIAFLVSRYFGLRHYGAIYGAVFVFFAVGSGFAPAVFGSVYDRFHTYTPILVVAASLFVVGGSLLLLLGKYPELREQKPNSVEVRD